MSEERKTIDVPPDQSYEYTVFGDKTKWCKTKYFWHGPIWEDIARALAHSNLPVYVMNSLIGAKADAFRKEIAIRGSFRREIFITKYAPRLFTNPFFHDLSKAAQKRKGDFDPIESSRIWHFPPMRQKLIKLPIYNDKFDELHYQVNGINLSDEWEGWKPAQYGEAA